LKDEIKINKLKKKQEKKVNPFLPFKLVTLVMNPILIP